VILAIKMACIVKSTALNVNFPLTSKIKMENFQNYFYAIIDMFIINKKFISEFRYEQINFIFVTVGYPSRYIFVMLNREKISNPTAHLFYAYSKDVF